MVPLDRARGQPTTKNLDIITLLEQSLIRIYLESKGYSLERLYSVPVQQAKNLRIEASVYASCRMAEIEFKVRVFGDQDFHLPISS